MSQEPETILLPSEEKLTEVTISRWSYKEWISVPSSESQIFTVLSYEPETILLSSEEKLTDITEPLWPSNLGYLPAFMPLKSHPLISTFINEHPYILDSFRSAP